ncbi:hypothetical protein [Nocardia altamirensis]|uniref:hypothetical protein n=1 Tax=Nocardia altamirensis TaxID=472158 RepID=UPI00114CDB03|nr:hypothetical protein [Nocardia altamirensis]
MSFVIVAGISGSLPARMTKSGTQPMPEDDEWGQITGWVADTEGYPGSVVVGTKKEGLKALSEQKSATVTAAIAYTGATKGRGAATKLQARLRVNSTIVATSQPPMDGPAGTLSVSATVDIAVGDVVTVEALSVPVSGGEAGTVSANTGTFVQIT